MILIYVKAYLKILNIIFMYKVGSADLAVLLLAYHHTFGKKNMAIDKRFEPEVLRREV